MFTVNLRVKIMLGQSVILFMDRSSLEKLPEVGNQLMHKPGKSL